MHRQILLSRGIALAWLGFWTYFVFAADIVGDGGWAAAGRIAIFALVFGSGVVAGWLWLRAGGALLMAIGLGLAVTVCRLPNPPATTAFLLLTMALPPIVAGALSWQAASRMQSA